jgi:hypothetical protein
MITTVRKRTRFSKFPEPNPLARVPDRTISTLDESSELLRQIDSELSAAAGAPHNPVATAEQRQTRLRYEWNPLDVPLSRRVEIAVPQLFYSGSTSSRAMQLEACLEDLRRWFGIGLDGVTRAVGISRGTVYAWRRRASDPRPATVSAVLRLHALVQSAVAAAGEERTRAFFHAGDPSPIERLLASGDDPTALSLVGREVRRKLSGPSLPAPEPLMKATVDDQPLRPLG